MTNYIKKLMSVILTFLVSLTVFAQVTTSSLNGRIIDESGAPLYGAVVIATHTPTGSQYHAITNSEGLYTIEGVRPGSDYEIEFSFLGCQTVRLKDVTLSLGETYVKNAELVSANELNEVVIVASNSKFQTEKTGASTNISNKQLTAIKIINKLKIKIIYL